MPCQQTSSSQRGPWSCARAPRCCSCTGRSTTTGRSPRASSTRASTSRRPPSARSRRRPVSTYASDRRCPGRSTPSATARPAPSTCTTGRPASSATTTSRRTGRTRRSTPCEWVRLDDAGQAAQLPARPGDARGVRRRPTQDLPARRAAARQGGRAQGVDRVTTASARSSTRASSRPSRWSRSSARSASTGSSSSTSKRCWTTVGPYADVADLDVEVSDELSEEDATADGVEKLVHEILERDRAHRALHPPAGAPARLRRPRGGRPEARARRDAGGAPPSRAGRRRGAAPGLSDGGLETVSRLAPLAPRPAYRARARRSRDAPSHVRRRVAELAVGVHPPFTRDGRSLHLGSLTCVSTSHVLTLTGEEVKLSSLRRTAAPSVAILALGLSLSACAAGNEQPSSGDASNAGGTTLSGTLNGAGSSAQEAAQGAWTVGLPDRQRRRHRQLRPGRLRRRPRAVPRRRRRRSPARTPTCCRTEELASSKKTCNGDRGVRGPGLRQPDRAGLQPRRASTSSSCPPRRIAGIFSGKITKWNDPAIAADNPDATPAVRPHHPGAPLGRLGHAGQLHPVPLRGRRPTRGPASPTASGRSSPARAPTAPPVSSSRSRTARARSASPTTSQAGDLGVASVKVGSEYVAPSAESAAKTSTSRPA